MGVALGSVLAARPTMLPFALTGRTDGLIACFPGDGASYGAHLDSNLHGGYNSGVDPRKVTAIAYLNAGWAVADGGALCLHDRHAGCWHTVAPSRDTLVLFRSDQVLHRVAPSYGWRLALTIFLTGEYR